MMKASNAAVERAFDSNTVVTPKKPQLKSIDVNQPRRKNLPQLSQKDALQEAMRRTG